MNIVRIIALIGLGLGVSACAQIEPASRNAPYGQGLQAAPKANAFNVTDVVVRVPRDLKVSEANSFLPSGDIVWHGDPPGDRYEQIKAIFQAAMDRGATGIAPDGIPAVLDVKVSRFHALTPKARYTFGGVHALQFTYTLLNPVTLEPYAPPKFVKADFHALGGAVALAAEAKGQTQKVRITDHLAEAIHEELTRPGGMPQEHLGLIGLLNQKL